MPLRKIDRRRLWRRTLVLFGLFSAGVTAPLLDLYGKNPEVFVANRSSAWHIVLFGLLIAFAPTLLAVLILYTTEKTNPKAGTISFGVLVGVGGAATGLAISRQILPEQAVAAVAVAVAITVGVLLLHRRFETGFMVFAVLGPLALGGFLFTSSTSALIWGEPAEAPTNGVAIENAANLVVLQLDELPLASLMDLDGTINEDLFPGFARLEATGHWYRNALSSSIATTQSVPALLTGTYGEKDASPSSVDHPENLFLLLSDSHEMHVVEWVTELCPEAVCEEFAGRAQARFSALLQDVTVVYGHLTLPAPIRDELPSIDGSWKGFLGQASARDAGTVDVGDLAVPDAPQRSPWIDAIQRLINGIDEDAPPTLHFAHLQAPHIPWQINPSGSHYERPEDYSEVDGVERGGFWVDQSDLALLGFQRHLTQLGFLDQRLTALFDTLEEADLYDEAMIVVVSDHGASFTPGEHRRWPQENNLADLYRVPLFVKLPGQTVGEVHDEPAFSVDVMPTIVDAMGIETDWEFDGQSLLTIGGTNRAHEPIYWCCNPDGASTDLSELFAQVGRNYDWVPDQDSWMGVASVGPYGDLVGTPVADLDPTQVDEVKWLLDQEQELSNVDRESGMVQTLVTGRLELPAGAQHDQVLIAVNGTVSGTGFLISEGGQSGELRGLIAEQMIVDGANDVSILAPDPNGGGWLTGGAADIAIEYVADDGHVLDINPEGSRRVEIDGVSRIDGGWNVSGWSADVTRKETADRVYVFAGDTLIAAGPLNKDNPNVVRWYKSDALLRSGFEFDIDDDLVPEDLSQFTVVAEFGTYAVDSPATLPR